MHIVYLVILYTFLVLPGIGLFVKDDAKQQY